VHFFVRCRKGFGKADFEWICARTDHGVGSERNTSGSAAFDPALRLDALGLEVRGLEVRRGYRLLFENLDLDLASGEILQLTGANGTGKSTLMRIIAGFSGSDAGEIRWLGLGAEDEAAMLLHYHGHREGLRDALTPAENLAFAAGILGGDAARIPAALERLDAGTLADLPVQVLSAGQRRRVALARLLVAPRPIWLLDEPLAALDTAGQALVSELLADHAAAGGMAIVATHQPLGIDVRHLALGREAA
jgi:heme exporter protein A